MRAKNHMTLAQARKESKRSQVVRLKRQMRGAGLPEPTEEHRFDPAGRRWRFDLSYPSLKVAVEYEGGTWSKNPTRHLSGTGYRNDCIKYSEAAILGWAVVRITADMLSGGKGLDLVVRAYESRAQLAEGGRDKVV